MRIDQYEVHRKRHRIQQTEKIIIAYLLGIIMFVAACLDTSIRFNSQAKDIMADQAILESRSEALAISVSELSAKVCSRTQSVVYSAENEVALPIATNVESGMIDDWMTFEVTAYCPCRKCCGKEDGITASGTKATEGRTVGADWAIFPEGTVIEMEGVGIRVVEDRGGAIKGNKLDLFFTNHVDALEFGRQTLKVRIIKNDR